MSSQRSRAWLEFSACFVTLTLLLAVWRKLPMLDWYLAVAIQATFVVASVALLWKVFRSRDASKLRKTWLTVLPESWGRWVLGESGKSEK
jgi:hypothetical protein